jgi:hypothetical protein
MSGEKSTSEPTQEVESIRLAEFLESIPPAQSRPVITRVSFQADASDSRIFRFRVAIPEIQLHCSGESCNGTRFFRAGGDHIILRARIWNNEYITYKCANCQTQQKTFALAILIETAPDDPKKPQTVHCYKFGEHPTYGPPTPARLISLVGPDRELFLKGRRCENQGLGIGAFVYYRRVVEEQKNRIIDEIIKVAQVLLATPDSIMVLENAKKEHQFSKAVESIKEAIPQRLLIAGQNPLTLLYSALSMGLHNQSDEKCLELAKDIRVILAEMSELLGQALKDERELKEAVSRLARQPGG